MKLGRPSIKSEAICAEVLHRISEGQSLRKIGSDPELPDTRTLMRWLDSDEEFRQRYARAKEASADVMAEEIMEIADDLSDDANSRRVRVDARKWIASKLKPKSYGERVEAHLSGNLTLDIGRALADLNSGKDEPEGG